VPAVVDGLAGTDADGDAAAMRSTGYGPSSGGPDEEFLRRMRAPENEIPVTVPLNTLLARSGNVALALLGLQVYSTGVSFDLAVRCRPGAVEGGALSDVFWGRSGGSEFLVGLEFADGRRVTSAGIPFPGRWGPDDIVFHHGGGSGDELTVDQSWWLNPLPPAGPLHVVIRCDRLGIGETRTVLDGAAISRAAAGVVELWPWEPAPELGPPEDRPPDVPRDSWFAGEGSGEG
jgi:hypothetical protein